MSLNEIPEINPKYYCEKCDTGTSNKKDFNKHLSTAKHKKMNFLNNCEQLLTEKSHKHTCSECNVSYKSRTGLWYHMKKCEKKNVTPDYMTIITQLLSQNNELKNFIIEQSTEHKKETNEIVNKVIAISSQPKTIINNSSANTNSNNKFNVNVFLDTECKDAMNFEDFVNGIEVSQEDIQNNGRLGFVDGISKIIMDNLNRLSVHQRPIHCTDWKREVLYIKDDNKWTKETDAKKIRDAIQVVSQKSIRTLHAWKMSNPDYKRGSSDFAMECIDMQLHSVAGEKREVYYPKVAKLVARHVLLDKKNG
jgi:hypothetical protein